MQTLLSRFCEEFVRIVRPLLEPIGRSVEAISSAREGSAKAKAVQPDLIELRHQMELLADKVADQQAYVLIFGPLKSGKSTLMNGICASYVSEVSSLPAYPCMVFVSHADQREFTVTDHNGKVELFSDPEALRKHVDRAHDQLAGRIRAAETENTPFDPQTHFREAIRRIDVRLPAGDLAQSSAVLVDTPGLYSRMKFGYDRMTRDFRNAAACAVFVVRSDNLFLEQVFAEFKQLLELFSRIFLVVNLDSTKQDLDPDGNLVPSLEQQEPERIIRAFENLAMSMPLKTAAEEGRLRIYPADLLHAASERLRRRSTAQRADDGAGKAATKAKDKGKGKRKENGEDRNRSKDRVEKNERAEARTVTAASDFEKFLKDLTDYLNSTDYLVAFLGDSIRRATGLIGESTELIRRPELRSLEQRAAELDKARRETAERGKATERLSGFDWNGASDDLKQDVGPIIEGHSQELGRKTAAAIDDAVDSWFRSNASLQDLVRGELMPLLNEHQEQLTAAVSKELSERILHGRAGLRLPNEIVAALQRADIDLETVGREAHARCDRNALITVPPTPLRGEHIPVRRTFWDWILFRSRSGVRRRLFGPSEQPAQTMPREQKAARLGEAAKRDVKRRLVAYGRDFFAETVGRLRLEFVGGYCRGVVADLDAAIRGRRAQYAEELAKLEAEHRACAAILEPLGELRVAADGALKSMEQLSRHYGQMDLYLLTKPVETGYRLPSEPPARSAVAKADSKADDKVDTRADATTDARKPAPGTPAGTAKDATPNPQRAQPTTPADPPKSS